MSDTSLDKLIATLKSEAIESAEKESSVIRTKATNDAENIIREARQERERILNQAEAQAKDIVAKGESTLRQAARDMNIELRNELIDLLGSVLELEVKKNFEPEIIKSAVVQAIENIGSDVNLKLSEQSEKEIGEFIHQKLVAGGKEVSILTDSSLLNSLSIVSKDEGWHYDITPEGIAEVLKKHLLGTWVDILNKKDSE